MIFWKRRPSREVGDTERGRRLYALKPELCLVLHLLCKVRRSRPAALCVSTRRNYLRRRYVRAESCFLHRLSVWSNTVTHLWDAPAWDSTHTTCWASMRTSRRGYAQLCEGSGHRLDISHMYAEVQAFLLHNRMGLTLSDVTHVTLRLTCPHLNYGFSLLLLKISEVNLFHFLQTI